MELVGDQVIVPSYGITLERQPLSRVDRTNLTAAVAAAKQPDRAEGPDLLSRLSRVQHTAGHYRDEPADHRPRDSDRSEPDPGIDLDEKAGQHHGYLVKLLGPLRVDDPEGRTVTFARSATPEFVAYLVHHPDGVEVGQAMNTLWPSTTARRTWIANVYADAARSLDDGHVGVTLTPRPGADDEYRPAGSVTSDIERFKALVTRAVSLPVDAAVSTLTDALAMVEGIPYSGITSRWPLAEGHWQDATVMVDEAARCVASIALDQFDDPILAEWATARGLLASPHSVELHRLRLRAAIALDGGADDHSDADSGERNERAGLSPDAVFQHYQAVVMADDHRPEATSKLDSDLVELYESYRRSRPQSIRSFDSDTLERQR